MKGLRVKEAAEYLNLRSFFETDDFEERMITTSEVNRPGLELAGFFEHFAGDRMQVIGMVETSYLRSRPDMEKKRIYPDLMGEKIPCIVLTRGMEPEPLMLQYADECQVPILGTDMGTSQFLSKAIRYLSYKLAPAISMHGVLVDVYGEGVLIMGESGIGKSEAALELVRRGHRLVTDDVVEIRKVDEETLLGTSPEITRHFIELRGIGIIDVKTLYGVEHVKEQQKIGLVIKLEDWDPNKTYDRLGLEEEYTEILGLKLPCHSIPIRPGRNLAVICESAAVNFRQKKMGYNAAHELYRRVQAGMGQSDIQ